MSLDASFSQYWFRSRFGKTMTLEFIALKPSGRFIAQITSRSVRILQVISCPIFWMLNTDGVPREKELRSMFYPGSFQMIANGESKFLAFSLQLPIAGFNLPYSFKKIALFRRCVALPWEGSNSLYQNWNEVR